MLIFVGRKDLIFMNLNRIIGMFLLGMPLAMQAQEKVVPIKYGDMD